MMLDMGSDNELRDVTGQRFNKLTAIEVASRSPVKWLCRCDCGARTVVSSASLRRGKTKSCGLAEWEERTGISSSTIQSRVSRGWSAADALTRPVDTRRRKKLAA
jgi:hypothetical protein